MIKRIKREATGFSRGSLAVRCVSVTAFLLLFALAVFGQGNNGQITGTVKDSSGAVAPNASIDARNLDTGTVAHGGTSATGNYVIPVPPGKYELTVTVKGFKTFKRTNLQVATATATLQDVILEVGAQTETITVTSEAPLLNTETGEISHTISTDDVDQLPVLTTAGGGFGGTVGFGNIRNPLQESILLPGVSFTNDTVLVVNGVPANSESIRTEGQDSTGTIWKVIQQNSQGGVDAIQEVAVQTSNFAAEYGQAAGGYFNYTMKSGTNLFHGSAYDYLVNEALNAGEPFTDAGVSNSLKDGQHIRNSSRRNDYGFTIGGPVRIPKLYDGRNKTFFFVNFEQFRQNNFTSGALQTAPTAAFQKGDFSLAGCTSINQTTGACNVSPTPPITFGGGPTAVQAVDPNGTKLFLGEVFDPNSGNFTRTPFQNNQIPVSRMDKVSLNIQSLMAAALPITAGNLGQTNNAVVPSYKNFQHTTNFSLKMDQAISPTIKLSGYYSQLNTYSPGYNGYTGVGSALTGNTPTDNWNHTIRLNYDQTITPTLLFHAGIGWFDTSQSVQAATPYDENALGLHGFYTNVLFPTIAGLESFYPVVGGWGPGFGGTGTGFTANIWEQKPTANTSLTWIRGNHTFKAGGEYVGEGYPDRSTWRANGNFVFSNAETSDPWQNGITLNGAGLNYGNSSTGFNYASFLLGEPDSFSATPQTDTRLGYHSLGFFLQDTWKVTRKLTLDLGLRYDYETYMHEQYGRVQDASFTQENTFNQVPFANGFQRPGAVIYETPSGCNCSFSHNYPFAFGPRLGFAYQLDTKTVLRGGIGIQYDAAEAPNGISYSTADYYTVNPAGYGIGPLQASGGFAGGNPYAVGNPYGNTPFVWPNPNPSKYPLYNAATGLAAPQSPFIFFDPNNRPGRIFTWSLGVQREVMRNLVVEVSYVGNRGAYFPAPSLDDMACNCQTPSNLLSKYGIDITSQADRTMLTTPISSLTAAQLARFPGLVIQGTGSGRTVPSVYPGFPASQTLIQALRGVPQWTTLTPWLGPPMGDTWYDSMQARVTKRYSHGLQAQGSLTWAKGLVNGASSDSTYFLPGAVATNDIFNIAQNKQLNQFVPPLAMIISLTYTTPKFSATGFAMKTVSQVARDWQLGAVLRYQSGALLEVPTSMNALMSELGRGGQTFFNMVPGQPLLLVDPNCGCFNPQSTQVLNPKAWTDAPGGTFGTSAPYYNGYRWMRIPQESMSLARNFRVGKEGKYVLQFRAEFYNVFNRLQLPAPTTTNPAGALSTGSGIINGGVNTYYSGGFGTLATANGAVGGQRNGQAVLRFQF